VINFGSNVGVLQRLYKQYHTIQGIGSVEWLNLVMIFEIFQI